MSQAQESLGCEINLLTHNLKVAGSNPAPATTEAPENIDVFRGFSFPELAIWQVGKLLANNLIRTGGGACRRYSDIRANHERRMQAASQAVGSSGTALLAGRNWPLALPAIHSPSPSPGDRSRRFGRSGSAARSDLVRVPSNASCRTCPPVLATALPTPEGSRGSRPCRRSASLRSGHRPRPTPRAPGWGSHP